MKTHAMGIVAAGLLALSTTSCMTTYDAYGRPVQSVDPALAVAGVAAAGIAGYAIAESNNNNNNYYHKPAPYYRPNYYHGHGYYAPPPRRPYYHRPYYRGY